MFNFPLASNEAIPFACPISLFIKFIPDVNVDKAVERFVILLCGISGIFAKNKIKDQTPLRDKKHREKE